MLLLLLRRLLLQAQVKHEVVVVVVPPLLVCAGLSHRRPATRVILLLPSAARSVSQPRVLLLPLPDSTPQAECEGRVQSLSNLFLAHVKFYTPGGRKSCALRNERNLRLTKEHQGPNERRC